ncbi:actyltransferase-like protein [Angomonas deanei]|uniref:Acetyltransferase (GNAT) family/Acetyltransferase (GNAT) domain/FR47-like protein, putative n=1 Tax=Angomonas deanei TaxID=59799 RepID=A0A7G2CKE3_9TRYP|nr:actyltransferase-like protein [Angomonas deanei]CAD2219547.1 Acetyltransferase (GNAT) family/Acetyltransferase (GNAT) domain/FR47-like protein, putative [Angomonas deanei]|eukprot:EPY38250.1 actyltransferase-like protein [Angomonas deanei]
MLDSKGPVNTPGTISLEDAEEKRRLYGSVTRLRDVVGRVMPVYDDSLKVRIEVFCGEQRIPLAEEIDDKDDVCIHVVAYVDTKGIEHYSRLLQERKKINTNILGGKINLKFSTPDTPQQLAASLSADYEPSYAPAGTLRMRRVRQTSELGNFAMMVAKLERICVLKKYRQSGIAERLVRRAEEIAKVDYHVPFVVLHGQVHAKNFYKRLGYEVKTDVFVEDGIDHVGMIKRLNTNGNTTNTKVVEKKANVQGTLQSSL